MTLKSQSKEVWLKQRVFSITQIGNQVVNKHVQPTQANRNGLEEFMDIHSMRITVISASSKGPKFIFRCQNYQVDLIWLNIIAKNYFNLTKYKQGERYFMSNTFVFILILNHIHYSLPTIYYNRPIENVPVTRMTRTICSNCIVTCQDKWIENQFCCLYMLTIPINLLLFQD
jgi:hypothetical protein